MGCPRKVLLGDNLVFGICCHDPDTGVLTDADSLPTYRVYKEEGATPVLGGKMSKLDDGNTTGFYSAELACTGRNGFEKGKTITIYIEATVDGDTGGMCFGVNVRYDPWTNIVVEGIDAPSSEFHHIVGRFRERY